MRIGASLGSVAAYALVVFAVGFSRRVARRVPDRSALPQGITPAMTAGVSRLIVGFGLKAAAAGIVAPPFLVQHSPERSEASEGGTYRCRP